MSKWTVLGFDLHHRRNNMGLELSRGFEGCPGGAGGVKITPHHRDLDSVPGCGGSGAVEDPDYFSGKGIYGLDFRTERRTALKVELTTL